MSQLETFVSRHGEPATYGMLENWARYMGLHFDVTATLEDLWRAFTADMSDSYMAPQYVRVRVRR